LSKLEVYPVTFILEGIGQAEGELYRVKAPQTAETIWYSLPLSGRVKKREQEEVYLLTDLKVKPEHETKDVAPGDIAYFPMQKSIHVYLETTQPYSEVNIVGKITKNLDLFKEIRNLSRMIIEKRD
jgi:hypothetical protein